MLETKPYAIVEEESIWPFSALDCFVGAAVWLLAALLLLDAGFTRKKFLSFILELKQMQFVMQNGFLLSPCMLPMIKLCKTESKLDVSIHSGCKKDFFF